MKSDKIESGRYGGSYGPWVSIYWNEVQQDIANNRTQVRLRFYFEWDRKIDKTFRSTAGDLYGSSFTYSGTARQNSGYGYVTLREQYVWITHDSDGTKSVTFSGSIYSLGLNWSGTMIQTMSASGTVRLTDIPRKHTVSGAKLDANLKPNTANRLVVTGSAPYTGHYYWAGIYDGSTNVYVYKVGTREYHTGTPIGGYPIEASAVNAMLNRMRNVTSKTFRFRLWTYSGNGTGNLGESAVDFTITVDDTVKPTISSLKASIWGTRRDKTINKYVQNYSYVESSFSSSGGYGSTITSNYITVRQDGTKANSQTISGSSGATSGVVTRSGTYEVIATATDGRGRSNTARTTLTVQAYSPPYITNFKAERVGGISATVQVDSSGGWSNLGGSNNLTVSTQRRVVGGSYANAKANTTETGGTFTNSFPTTGNSVSSSYQYRLYISDSFGNVAESVVSVGTAKVLFDKHKDLGIGIGKLHERGELDVAGEAFFRGKISLDADDTGSVLNLTGNTPTGHGYISYFGSDNVRKAYAGFGGHTTTEFSLYNESGGNLNLRTSGSGKVMFNGLEPVEEGQNSNGNWMKFAGGTMICRGYTNKSVTFTKEWGSLYYANIGVMTFPQEFAEVPYIAYTSSSTGAAFIATTQNRYRAYTGNIDIYRPNSSTTSIAYELGYIAIGRWK